jgi:hypothetical protein
MEPEVSLPCSQESASSLSWARRIHSTSSHSIFLLSVGYSQRKLCSVKLCSQPLEHETSYTRVYPKVSGLTPGARTTNGTALCHCHNPLFCFSTSVYCCYCLFRCRFRPETFGYTVVLLHARCNGVYPAEIENCPVNKVQQEPPLNYFTLNVMLYELRLDFRPLRLCGLGWLTAGWIRGPMLALNTSRDQGQGLVLPDPHQGYQDMFWRCALIHYPHGT